MEQNASIFIYWFHFVQQCSRHVFLVVIANNTTTNAFSRSKSSVDCRRSSVTDLPITRPFIDKDFSRQSTKRTIKLNRPDGLLVPSTNGSVISIFVWIRYSNFGEYLFNFQRATSSLKPAVAHLVATRWTRRVCRKLSLACNDHQRSRWKISNWTPSAQLHLIWSPARETHRQTRISCRRTGKPCSRPTTLSWPHRRKQLLTSIPSPVYRNFSCEAVLHRADGVLRQDSVRKLHYVATLSQKLLTTWCSRLWSTSLDAWPFAQLLYGGSKKSAILPFVRFRLFVQQQSLVMTNRCGLCSKFAALI